MELYQRRKEKMEAINKSVLIEISDLSKQYNLEGDQKVRALKNITLEGDG